MGAKLIGSNLQEALKVYENTVTLDPRTYEDKIAEGSALIDQSAATKDVKGLPADLVKATKSAYIEKLTKDYFEGKIRSSKSPQEVEAVLEEMAQPHMKERMKPANAETLISHARTTMTSISEKATQEARAAVGAIKDRMTSGEKIDEAEIAATDALVRRSVNPSVFNDWQKAQANYRTTVVARGSSKEAVDNTLKIEQGRRFPNLTNDLNAAVDYGVALSGNKITAEYIAASLRREGGREIDNLRKTGGSDYDFKNDKSTARGPYQFLDKTWMEYLPKAAAAYKLDIAGKSKEELLALRADPKTATAVFVTFSLENKLEMEKQLGRRINEGELYMGHFMGAAGASKFLKAWRMDPSKPVDTAVSSDAISSNLTVFLNSAGDPKSLGQVYAEISSGFHTGIDAAGHERIKALEKVQKEQAALNEPHGDPMTYNAKHAQGAPADLKEANGFSMRAQQALQQQDLYRLRFPKPLTQDEVADYKKRIEDGSVPEAVQALRDIGKFGGPVTEGAVRQLGEKNGYLSHLAGLFYQGGAQAQVAEDIIKGMREVKANPKIAEDRLKGAGEGGTVRKFDAYVGEALSELDPQSRFAAHEAADAYYVAKLATKGDGSFSDRNYRRAIDAVLAETGLAWSMARRPSFHAAPLAHNSMPLWIGSPMQISRQCR